jgi:fatty-acyl-CoA synthase
VVPFQIPLRIRDADAFADRMARLTATAGCKLVVADPGLLAFVGGEVGVPWDDPGRERSAPVPPSPRDFAVVQFTSGSTADPRAALITHAAAMAQMANIAERTALPDREHILAAWAPFFHDLGLVGSAAYPMVAGVETHILPTERFARDPLEWYRIINLTSATLTVGPCSAYSATLRAAERRSEYPNLATLRQAWFGADAVDPVLADRLRDSAGRFDLDPAAFGSTYGLAETVLAVCASLPGDGLRIDEVSLGEVTAAGRAVPSNGGRTRRFVSAGAPGSSFELRITREGSPLGEREVGEILVRGPSLMSGYLGAPDPFADGWLPTGDLGYLADGELYVTGRLKDVIIVMGQNYYPEDFEWAAGRVDGVRAGRCVAFAPADRRAPVLLVEPSAEADPGDLPTRVSHAVADAVGVAPAEVVVLGRGAIEKTSSGKLRRAAMKKAYEDRLLSPVG